MTSRFTSEPTVLRDHVRRYRELRAEGYERADIEEGLRVGAIRRVARDWYAFPDADPRIVGPLALKTRATCVTGGALHGLWVPDDSAPHVAIRQGDPNPDGPCVVHRLAPAGFYTRSPIMPLVACLREIMTCVDHESALICLESAVAKRRVSAKVARRLLAELPERERRRLMRFDPASESGSETRVRLYFQRRRIDVRSQVVIPGVGRVDLLVGKSIIVECDSREHHATERAYAIDRARDLAAMRQGYTVIRLTWEQVFLDWDITQQVLLGLTRARRRVLRPAA